MTPVQATLLSDGLDKVWPFVDPKKRTFRQALADAFARGAAENWPAGDPVAYADAQAFAIGTQFYIELLKDRPDDIYSSRWATALKRTLEILAKKVGYTGREDPAEVQANVPRVLGVAWVPIIELVAAVLGVAAFLIVVYFLITRSQNVVDSELSRNVLERELVRTHTAAESIIDKHLAAERAAGHSIEWSVGERAYLEALEKIQAQIIHALSVRLERPLEEESIWATPWPWIGVTAGALAVLGFVYRDELKAWMRGEKEKRRAA